MTTNTWLVTGGAGYIGSHVVRALQEAGLTPIVLDDLSSGHASFVPEDVPLVEGSILDAQLVQDTLQKYVVDGVIHVAGYKYAGESVKKPFHTYEQNVEGTRVLLEAMAKQGIQNIVFSSSAAVYGTPDVDLVVEDTPKAPASPYGESKLIGEWLIRDASVARPEGNPLRYTNLRYFNVVGSGYDDLYDSSPHNLFPIVFEKLLNGETPRINGDDYNTPDGTNVRDYVHVKDLADAHVVAAQRLASGEPVEPAYNLGSQNGLSVKEIMDAMVRGTGIDFVPEIGPRRPGDPDRIVATGEAAARDLNWQNRYTVDEMVQSGWQARKNAG